MCCKCEIKVLYLCQQNDKDMDKRLYRLLNIVSRLSYQASKFMNDPVYNYILTIEDRINYREILRVRETRLLTYITENYGKEKD